MTEMTLDEYRATQKAPRQRNRHEEEMQMALFAWRDRMVGQHPILERLTHWPNGEKRDKATAAKLHRMGVSAGWPDVWLFWPRLTIWGWQSGICLELKAGKNQLSADQKRCRLWLIESKFEYEVVYDDWTIAARLVAAWCGLPEEVVP